MTDHPDEPLSEAEEARLQLLYESLGAEVEQSSRKRDLIRALVRDVRRERDEDRQTLESIRRFLSGEQVGASTGIDESVTFGYGKLDSLGYWEYPVPPALVSLRATLRAQVESLTREKEALVADCEADHPPEPWAAALQRRAEKAETERDALRAEVERQKQIGHDYISRTDPLLSCGYHEADAGTPGEPCGSCRMCALEEVRRLRGTSGEVPTTSDETVDGQIAGLATGYLGPLFGSCEKCCTAETDGDLCDPCNDRVGILIDFARAVRRCS